MKAFKMIGLALMGTLTGASFSACTGENEEVFGQDTEIRLTSEITPSRVTSLDYQSTQIVAEQQVGVTITNAKAAHNNVAWTAGADGALTNTGSPLYYTNKTAIITAYHPYNNDWRAASSYLFSVNTDQSIEANYRNSDLLWATASSNKTANAVPLTFTHKLAKINVTLQSTDISNLNGATISICGTNIATNFNPSTGDLSAATANVQEIKAGVTTTTDKTASAIIVPQTVAASTPFIKVTLGEKIFYHKLSAEKTFVSGKSYSYTLTVKEKKVEVDTEGDIKDWEDEENTGDANEVITTVNVQTAGSLSNLISESDKNTITSLKITGNLNGTDIKFLREMAGRSADGNATTGKLTNLDLTNANIVAGGDYYIKYYDTEYTTENNIAGDYMFFQCNLETIKFPLTVTKLGKEICSHLYISDNHKGTFTSITIPNGIEIIGDNAFAYNRNLTSIELPNTIKEIGANVFYRCDAITSIYIPNSVEKMLCAFYFAKGLQDLHLP